MTDQQTPSAPQPKTSLPEQAEKKPPSPPVSSSHQKKTLWRRLRFWMLSLSFFGMLCLTLLSVFSVPLAQWSLERLRSRGLRARVHTADFFRGRLGVQRLRLRQKRQTQELRLKARQATLHLDLWRLLWGRFREISTLEVQAPSITIYRRSGATIPTTRPRRKRQWKRLQKALRGNAGTLLRIVRVRIVRGDITFVDESRPTRKVRVHIGQLNTSLHQWKGLLELKRVKTTVQNPWQTLTLQIPEIRLRFNFHDFLNSPIPVLREVRLTRPDIRIHRKRHRPRPPQHPRLSSQVQIQRLLIEKGRLFMKGNLRGGRTMKMRIARFDGDFKHFVGVVHLRQMRLQMNALRRKVRFRVPTGRLRLDLTKVFQKTVPFGGIVLHRPQLNLTVRGQPNRRHKPRKWILIQDAKVINGSMFLDSQRQRRGKQQRVRLRLTRVQAHVRGLDLHQFLAKPFSGSGQMRLQGLGPMRFVIKKRDARHYSWHIPNLPLQALLRLKDGPPPPFRFYSGTARIDVRFSRTAREFWVDSTLRIQHLALKVTMKKRGLKRLALRGVFNLLNKRAFALPEGYVLKASFVLDEPGLFDDPKSLMKKMSRKWVLALIDSLARKHRLIAMLKPRLLQRLNNNGGKDTRKRTLRDQFKDWRKKRKAKREQRRAQRRKKWAKLRQQWKQKRERRKKKRKAFLQKLREKRKQRRKQLKQRFKHWRNKQKSRWQRFLGRFKKKKSKK